jgi:hypothetical protein
VPALIILHVAVVAVVGAVADAPAVVWHQDAGVRDVANLRIKQQEANNAE